MEPDAHQAGIGASLSYVGESHRRLRVFVLSDVRLYSDGLASLLSAEPAIEIVGTGGLRAGCTERVVATAPDVLLIDAVTLRQSDVARSVAAQLPSLLVVACGVSEEPDEVMACAQSGAAGYVARDASAADLVQTVTSLQCGELRCSPRISSMLFRQIALPTGIQEPSMASQLTAREREVVPLIDRGMSNKEIAVALSIEVATVKNHVHHILEKLAVRRRSGVAAQLRRRPFNPALPYR